MRRDRLEDRQVRVDVAERVHDAPDRAEEADEGGGRADGREEADGLFEARGRELRGLMSWVKSNDDYTEGTAAR